MTRKVTCNRLWNRILAIAVIGILAASGCNAEEAVGPGHPDMYSAESIEGWVVDANTNKPLEGVIVVAAWVLNGWTLPGIKFDRVGTLELMESVTDSNGRFFFSGWGPVKRPKNAVLWAQDPELLFFKSGYDIKILSNPLTAETSTTSVRTSQWDGKTIPLKKFKDSVRDYASRIQMLGGGSIRDALESCMWRKIPRTIVALRKEDLWLRARGEAGVFWQRMVPREGHKDPCGARAFWEEVENQ